MSASQAVTATQEWAAAYAKNPEDPRNVIGYARTLKALGSDDKALEILKTAFQASPTNGDIAAELGRLALETESSRDRQARAGIGGPAGHARLEDAFRARDPTGEGRPA